MKMKSSERYELIKQGLSEGKKKADIAREMNVTPALISQVMKKHAQPLQVWGTDTINQEAAAETAEA
jgi:DNA-binding NarL/FixJ family response regulator